MGGDTRHFATLVADLSAHQGFAVRVINTSRGRRHSDWPRNMLLSIRTMAKIASQMRKVDIVSYHASDRGMLLFGPIVLLLCRMAGKPTILRVFGGSFGDSYGRQSRLRKWLTRRTVLTADVLLLQTKRSVRDMQLWSRARVIWFSTYVKSPARLAAAEATQQPETERGCRRFIFLGHLWRTKGIETLLESATRLPGDCTIDIYGPPDEYSADEINRRGEGRVKYRGFLNHGEVSERLWEYDCLVLPTFHSGEGYPGVIAEAYAHELPVIATNWMAIPEIVDDGCGILIEPQDTTAFVDAVTTLYSDSGQWLRLKRGAREKAKQFDHAVWAQAFESICASLAGN